MALASFYENDSEPDVQEVESTVNDDHDVNKRTSRRKTNNDDDDEDDDDDKTRTTNRTTSVDNSKKSNAGNNKKKTTRFGTVHTLNTNAEDDYDDGTEEGQAFYAGGSEHSGQQVLGPPKRHDNIVADMFKSVRE